VTFLRDFRWPPSHTNSHTTSYPVKGDFIIVDAAEPPAATIALGFFPRPSTIGNMSAGRRVDLAACDVGDTGEARRL